MFTVLLGLPLLGAAYIARAQGHLSVQTPRVVDFGRYPAWEQRVAHFQILNTGDTELAIKGVRTSCGCATAGLGQNSLLPKQDTLLSVSVHPNSILGDYKKATTIRSSDPSSPITQVWIKGHAVPLVAIHPKPFITAGLLGLDRPRDWCFTLTPNRQSVSYAPLQLTSSVPVTIEFTKPTETNATATLTVHMPPQTTPAKLNVTITTTATYETNAVPLTFDIAGLIGEHLVAVPSQLTVTPHGSQRCRIRLHIVGPRHVNQRLGTNALALPDVEGITFGKPTPDHTGKGLIVTVAFDSTFAKRVQNEQLVPIVFSSPGTAPATVLCKAPTAQNAARPR